MHGRQVSNSRLEEELVQRPDHPHGDLPAVGDEHPLEHDPLRP
jgi:hypothetical protein